MVTAKQIRRTREALGESQATFGRRFGVDQGTVSRWESGERLDRRIVCIAIERVLADLQEATT